MNEIRKRVLDLVQNGAYARAVAVAFEATRRHPRDPQWFELLAFSEAAAGYTKAAIKTISTAIALTPQRPLYWFHRGQLHFGVDSPAAAIADMERVIELERALGVAEFSPRAEQLRDEAQARLEEQAKKPLRSLADARQRQARLRAA